MNTIGNEKAPHAIVVGVDYSEFGDLALERACTLATSLEGAHLHVVHVAWLAVPEAPDVPTDTHDQNVRHASKRLRAHADRIVKRWCETQGSPVPFERLTTHIRSGNPAEAIAQLAADVQAELVVVGTHGQRGRRRFLVGPVAEETERLAPCPVIVVRESDADVPRFVAPCPRCLERRQATDGKELWCEQHRAHHDKRHSYHHGEVPDDHQSSLLIHQDD